MRLSDLTVGHRAALALSRIVDGAFSDSWILHSHDCAGKSFMSKFDDHIVLTVANIPVAVLALVKECTDVLTRQ